VENSASKSKLTNEPGPYRSTAGCELFFAYASIARVDLQLSLELPQGARGIILLSQADAVKVVQVGLVGICSCQFRKKRFRFCLLANVSSKKIYARMRSFPNSQSKISTSGALPARASLKLEDRTPSSNYIVHLCRGGGEGREDSCKSLKDWSRRADLNR
jgi:hypothetical protein